MQSCLHIDCMPQFPPALAIPRDPFLLGVQALSQDLTGLVAKIGVLQARACAGLSDQQLVARRCYKAD